MPLSRRTESPRARLAPSFSPGLPQGLRGSAFAVAACMAAGASAQNGATLPLLPPSATGTQAGGIATRAATVLGTQATPSGLAIKVRFDLPEAYLWYDSAELTDASGYDGMFFKVKNTGTTVADFTVELHSPMADGNSGKFITGVHVAPGETQRVSLMFEAPDAPRPWTFTPADIAEPSQVWQGGFWNFDRTKVAGFLMWNTTPNGATVELQDLKLIKKRTNFAGAVDAYGQYAFLDWPGKVTSDADLASANANEQALLSTQSDVLSPDTTAAFGSTTPTGKWRFEKAPSGNWFLVTPTGRRTWTVGLNNISAASGTMVQGREGLFQSYPAKSEATAQFYSFGPNVMTGFWGDIFNFYGYNASKKYGANYKPAWTNRTLTRLHKWGINTGISPVDPTLVDAGLPYVTRVEVFDFPTKLAVPAVGWWYPVDPYAPNFRSWMADRVRRDASDALSGRGNSIGITIGNEETWGWVSDVGAKYQIPVAALNAPMSQPGKAAMLNLLKRRYGGSVRKLATAWRKNWTTWAPLEGQGALPFTANISPAMKADLSALLSAWAQQYYSTIKLALGDSGYTGLWLGTREAMDLVSDECLDAQNRYVDAHTINLYNTDSANWARVARLTKPVILSEFSYSAIDRGLSTPDKRFECNDQGHRARCVRAYLDRAAAAKNVVGAWFYQYVDEIVTGRESDDERMNLGLIDVTDTPYPEVTGTFRDFAVNLPSNRRLR